MAEGDQREWLERLDPGRKHPLWGEHRARYRLAMSGVSGCRVLDAACGNGYGVEMLRRAGAGRVAGLDLSGEAVREAATRFGARRAWFVRGDLADLPFPDEAFDVVTSFESIEHVPDAPRVISEFSRVLAPGGTLFVSSPNGAIYPGGHSGNPFHHHEFRVHELEDLLGRAFARVTILGQSLRRRAEGVLDYSGQGPGGRMPDRLSLLRRVRRSVFSALPLPLKEVAWRTFRGEGYYPAEDEFEFVTTRPELYPVLVAVCRVA